jgi:transcriptional regulator with XRE-family HTH domain
MAGVHPSTLSRWEAGVVRPSLYEFDALMSALGVSEAERRRALELIDAPRALFRLHEMQSTPAGLDAKPRIPLPGDLLRAMRQRRGWSLEQTAGPMHISVATLSRWEHSEAWPSESQMHYLCYLLQAHPQELAALSAGRLHFHSEAQAFPSRQDELRELLRQIVCAEVAINRDLADLYFLSLERHLWGLSQQGEVGRRLLIDAYVCHCRHLLQDARVLEAQMPAARALHLIGRWENPGAHWLWVVHAIAKDAAEKRYHPNPSEGIRILQDWLPLSTSLSILYEAWFLRDIAEYMSLTHATRAAVETSTRAVGKGLGLGDDRNVWLSHAEVLLNTKNPQQALEVIESHLDLAWEEDSVFSQQVREAQIYARALYGVGRTHEALLWVKRAQQLVQQHNLWQVRHRVDALATQIR